MSLAIDLSGRVALVTGASSGIGAGIALMLAKAGADVAGCGLSDSSSAKASALESAIRALGRRAFYQQTNVENPGDLESLVSAVINEFGRIDILVSNAGRNVFRGAENCTEAEWIENMNLNLASHWRLAKLCKPHLEASGRGVVQIMTSNHAWASIPGCFPYNVAKTALTGLVRSLAIEWGPKVRVVGIAPGFIETQGNDAWFASFSDPSRERERTIQSHPAGKLGSPEEIGAWSAFLASDYAAFSTGTTYLIDGGRLALLQDSLNSNMP